MRLLTLRDLNVEDSLSLHFDGAFDQQAGLEHELEPFLQALEEYAGEWMPTLVKGTRRRNYSREAVWKALAERRNEYNSIIGLHRPSSPAVSLTLHLGRTPHWPVLGISLHVQPLSFFSDAERCRRFVDMVRAWTSRYPVPHASAHSAADEELAGAPYFGRDVEVSRRDGFDKVYEVFWLNVFSPKLVETVGRERMMSTPAHRVEALPDGSILLVTWPTAADFASEEARVAQARALIHLRPELDFDTVLRTLRERSATLAPVEPRFHPDVAPLLSRVLDEFAISERQRKIAEFNTYQPPEPEEWLPAPLPSDVEDAEKARGHYSYLAELLVALLHTDVPSVFKATPESLTDVDAHFWHQDFPESFERWKVDEHAVPAVGAYLGEVLVRNLGGEWIPRKKLEEAQVRVGNRVWLPFVRAHRYMRSTQSLVDYSLTQLYRVAARYRSPG
ncbi:hypothetical protein [Myxococcus sp. RHSTA-1-4]|uniref:hypothetical protein n=1 Tax=Myxococcus sp. RHSTA-1-4 TaxID=2874601 RepID=UPI001CBFC834|nr:hypothetical protein [Myxococcus sp. RHSTA-1-4]MBZ4420707.1 hypothetical protein [Myxococcus sp. RHSTA-1-4]